MREGQKQGFSIILGALIFIILAFVVSEDYSVSADGGYFSNFMNGSIGFSTIIGDCEFSDSSCYLFSLPAKWAVFIGICVAGYGLLVYKEIMRFPPWKK